MKIYFIGQKGIPAKFGGVERHVEDLSVGLAAAGHDVFVYTRPNYTDKTLSVYKKVNLISLPSIGSKYLDAISHTFRACLDLIKRDVDVVHVHSIGPASLVWLIKLLKPKTPIVFTFHTKDYYHQKWGVFARAYLHFGELVGCFFSDRIIAISLSLQQHILHEHNLPASYLPNGVNLPKTLPAKQIKKMWDLEKNGYILVVSRLVRHKGIHHLINAYNKLNTKKKLVITGDGAFTDDYVWELNSLAAENPNIIFTGNQSGDILNELFSNAYLFVQPSEAEGLSIALLEAMSYGKTVLVSDIPENLEAMGGLGYSFVNKDVDDLADRLQYLLKRPATVVKSGSAGKMRVKKEYSWEDITGGVIMVYNQVVFDRKFMNQQKAKLRLVRRFTSILF